MRPAGRNGSSSGLLLARHAVQSIYSRKYCDEIPGSERRVGILAGRTQESLGELLQTFVLLFSRAL